MFSYAPTPTVGEIIQTQFMDPLHLTIETVAHAVQMPKVALEGILNGTVRITEDTSPALCKYFCVENDYFLRLQHIIDVRSQKC